MKRDLLIAAFLFVLVGLGSWAAKSLGLYNTYWFTDVILHAVAGAGFGMLWLSFPHKAERGKWMFLLGAASFAVLGSVGWELWEFAGSKIISPESMRYYKPELGDSLGDICSGFAGGILVLITRLFRRA